MSFACTAEMFFFLLRIFTIGSQGGLKKMAASNVLWLYFLRKIDIDPVFF